MRIDGLSSVQYGWGERAGGAGFARELARAGGSDAGDAAGDAGDVAGDGVARADFTRMTRRELVDWMNGEIRAGRLDLDQTSVLVGLTIRMPVDGQAGSLELDDTERVDFHQLLRDGVAGAEWRDAAARDALAAGLALLGRYQLTA